MSTTRNDNPLFIPEILRHTSQYLDMADLTHLKMANKRLNKIFHPDITRKQLENFSIKEIIELPKYTKRFIFLDSLGCVYEGYLSLEDNSFPIQPLKLPSIKSIVKSTSGIILLSHQGQVWVYGLNLANDLGTDSSGLFNHLWKPVQLKDLPVITQIASYGDRSFFLDDAGAVWRCGRNDITMGEEGIKTIKTPMPLKNLPPIRKIISTCSQVFFIDYLDDVWQCKMPTFQVPVKINDLSNIKDIYYHNDAYFINKEGEVYLQNNTANPVSFEKIPGLKDIKYIVASYDNTYYVNHNNQVYITGRIVEDKNGTKTEEKYTDPTRIEKFDSVKHILIPNSFLQCLAILIEKTGNVNFCCSSTFNSYEKLLKLSHFPDFNAIDNGYVHPDVTMFVRKGGNITIHKMNKQDDTAEVTNTLIRFNFATQYHLDVLHRNSCDMNNLVRLACEQSDDNKIFYDACMNVLRSESDVIRLYYLMQLEQSPWFDMNECATILIYPRYAYSCHFDFKQVENSLAPVKAIRDFYDYLHLKIDHHADHDYQFRLQNFTGLISKLLNNEINDISDLNNYFLIDHEMLTKRSFTLFSYQINVSRMSHDYADLQEKLLKSLDNKNDHFLLMKKALLFMNKVFLSYTGDHPLIKKMMITTCGTSAPDLSKVSRLG